MPTLLFTPRPETVRDYAGIRGLTLSRPGPTAYWRAVLTTSAGTFRGRARTQQEALRRCLEHHARRRGLA